MNRVLKGMKLLKIQKNPSPFQHHFETCLLASHENKPLDKKKNFFKVNKLVDLLNFQVLCKPNRGHERPRVHNANIYHQNLVEVF